MGERPQGGRQGGRGALCWLQARPVTGTRDALAEPQGAQHWAKCRLCPPPVTEMRRRRPTPQCQTGQGKQFPGSSRRLVPALGLSGHRQVFPTRTSLSV